MAEQSVLREKVRLYFDGRAGMWHTPRSFIMTTPSLSFPSLVSGSTAELRSPSGEADIRPTLTTGCNGLPSATTWPS